MILVFDIYNAAYRGTWTTPTTLTPQGFNVTPLFAVIKILARALRIYSGITQVVIASDPVTQCETNWRRVLFPKYKEDRIAHRKTNARAEALSACIRANMPYVRAFFQMVPCVWLEDPAEEADDLMAMAAGRWAGTPKLIMSRDWDMLQLVALPMVELAYPEGGEYVVINRANFETVVGGMVKKHKGHSGAADQGELNKMQCPMPLDLWPAFRSIVGDRSDCINGLVQVKASRGYDIVMLGGRYTSSRSSWDIFSAWWARVNRNGDARNVDKNIVIKNPDAQAILERNDRLMRLDPHKAPALRSSFYGCWSPDGIRTWFRELNFTSMLPGGRYYEDLFARFGALRVT